MEKKKPGKKTTPPPKRGAGKKKPKTGPRKAGNGSKQPAEGRSIPPVVGIGASAGGLEAFDAFFSNMPADAGCAFVLVSHLDPKHFSILPELIQKHTQMKVHLIQDGMAVEPDMVYVIPPNQNLAIMNGTLQLMELAQPRQHRLPIDSFLRSLARDQGPNAVSIILSGTGSDGAQGIKAIKAEAGMVMVQDADSAKYDGMPKSALSTGLADYVLPPGQMPEQLVKYLRHPLKQRQTPDAPAESGMETTLQKTCLLLRTQTGHDFSLYKKSTVLRRIERRMRVHQIQTPADYVRYLQRNENELDVLFKELLIGVTSFFRDPLAFESLGKDYLTDFIRNKPDGYAMRVWVAGCSSGEEAYSIAILIRECMEAANRQLNVQIFATDIDKDAVNQARSGTFPAGIAADVGEDRLNRWFSREDNQYRIHKTIREMVVFALQSIVKDPPFTKLDLLCCRNLLIYIDPELQKQIIPMFHYSLKPDGVLFLGSSESIGNDRDLFAPLNRKWKIFKRKPASRNGHPVIKLPVGRHTTVTEEQPSVGLPTRTEEPDTIQLLETILRQVEAPPCVIIDDANNIVYFHGRTGRYLEPVVGKASVNILEMARPGLRMALGRLLRNVAENRQEESCRGISVELENGQIMIDLTVKPIQSQHSGENLMMVLFKEVLAPEDGKQTGKAPRKRGKPTAMEMLEQELQYTRENLQTTIEELETSNEELKSTNEEMQSTNEELQSTNEELETSREELQSLNEEAATVNAELQSRIDELSSTNDDMKNLLDSTQIATIFLDLDLCVRRFTPRVVDIIPLSSIDSGRSIRHFATALVDTDLAESAREVLQDLGVKEQEVASKDGSHFRMRVRPYRTTANVIDGVVITFEDITALIETQKAVNRLNRELQDREDKRKAD